MLGGEPSLHRALTEEEKSPQIIKTMAVVGVGVGVQHPCEITNLVAQDLRTEIRRCVYHDVLFCT